MQITDRQNKKWQNFGKPSGYLSSLGNPFVKTTTDIRILIQTIDFAKVEAHFFASTLKKIKGYRKHQRRLKWRKR